MILTISLFLLGIGFILLGWRWQTNSNDEVLTVLRGLTHLKNDLQRIQKQVDDHVWEDKVQAAQEFTRSNLIELAAKETLKSQDEVLQRPQVLAPKYQEVLALAANGQRIPEIAQKLLISQDAVRMVLITRIQGGVR